MTNELPASVGLDRDREPWVGRFPGLGAVLVHDDGRVDVEVEPDDSPDSEAAALREAALRYGRSEPLSLVRLGFRFAWGSGLVDQGEPVVS